MGAPIPFVDLQPTVREVMAHARPDIDAAFSGAAFINAPIIELFEDKLAAYVGARHAVTCANGTDALVMALRVRGIGPGSRVAVPNLTFWATYEAVKLVGATAILVDVNPLDLQMDFSLFVETCKIRGIDALLLVHLFGWASPQTQMFRDYCRKQRIVCIEDAAQAIGARLGDAEPLLKRIDIAALSFHPAKVLGGCMDGGAVITNDPRTAELLRSMRNHGRGAAHYEHVTVGVNSRMSAVNAAYLHAALDGIDARIQRRGELLAQIAYAADNYTVTGPAGLVQNNYLYITLVETPDAVAAKLAGLGIGSARTYPMTIADQPGTEGAERGPWTTNRFKASRDFCKHVINLPLWYGMTDEAAARIGAAFKEATKG